MTPRQRRAVAELIAELTRSLIAGDTEDLAPLYQELTQALISSGILPVGNRDPQPNSEEPECRKENEAMHERTSTDLTRSKARREKSSDGKSSSDTRPGPTERERKILARIRLAERQRRLSIERDGKSPRR